MRFLVRSVRPVHLAYVSSGKANFGWPWRRVFGFVRGVPHRAPLPPRTSSFTTHPLLHEMMPPKAVPEALELKEVFKLASGTTGDTVSGDDAIAKLLRCSGFSMSNAEVAEFSKKFGGMVIKAQVFALAERQDRPAPTPALQGATGRVQHQGRHLFYHRLGGFPTPGEHPWLGLPRVRPKGGPVAGC